MPIFQPGGTNAGYRAPAKTQTIKALQDRQKAMQAAAEANAANAAPVTNIAQGIGALTNQLGDSFQQNRVANQEADARAQLAQIMTQIDPNQGASMAQIAAMQQLDPEFANKEYERAMGERAKIADREDTQAFTGGQNDLTRQAEADRQRELFGHQDTTAETLAGTQKEATTYADKLADENADDEAARTAALKVKDAALTPAISKLNAGLADGSITQDQYVTEVKRLGDEFDANLAKNKVGTQFGPIKTAGELGLAGDPNVPYQQDANTKEWQPVNKGGGVTVVNAAEKAYDAGIGGAASKRMDQYIQEGSNARDFISQVRMVADLGKSVGTGKWAQVRAAAGPYLEMLPWTEIDQLGEAQAYEAITNKMAPNMRPANSGSSSNYDAQQFLKSLQSLGNDPEGNAVIEATFEALMQDKMAAAEIAAKADGRTINPATKQPYTWQEAEAEIRALPNPYDNFKKFMSERDAAAAAGGETTVAPAVPAVPAGKFTIEEETPGG